MKTLRLLWLAVMMALVGCSDASGPVDPPLLITPQLAIVAGEEQTDTVMRTLPVQIAAALTDKATGDPLPGRIVNWLVIEGGGTVFAPVSQTGSDGVARQTFTLGSTAGRQRMVARWLDPETGEPVTLDTVEATALPDTATSFVIAWNDMQILHPALDTIGIAVRWADTWNNTTWGCGKGQGATIDLVLSEGMPYGADSLVRYLGLDPVAQVLVLEVGGYTSAGQSGGGTTVLLEARTTCGVSSATLRFDWQ